MTVCYSLGVLSLVMQNNTVIRVFENGVSFTSLVSHRRALTRFIQTQLLLACATVTDCIYCQTKPEEIPVNSGLAETLLKVCLVVKIDAN